MCKNQELRFAMQSWDFQLSLKMRIDGVLRRTWIKIQVKVELWVLFRADDIHDKLPHL